MKYQIGNNFLIMETRFALFFYLKNMKISYQHIDTMMDSYQL